MREDLLSSHFKDTAVLKRYKSTNDYNERNFEDPVDILCRKVYKTQIVKRENNEDIVSTISIYTFTKIGDKDNIDGKDVLSITEWKSLLDNEVVGYKILI